MAINWTDAQIEDVVKAVINNLSVQTSDKGNKTWDSTQYCGRKLIGIYEKMEDAIDAARAGYLAVRAMSLSEREKVIAQIRSLCRAEAPVMAALGVSETKMGKVEHKTAKHILVADKTPGTSDIVSRCARCICQRLLWRCRQHNPQYKPLGNGYMQQYRHDCGR